ncbi:HAD family hydrolase [Arthrobacter sp. MYb227]|uniref:HAD family hydrolase n=1 Tax=Arthrobacter sp. MYb227 TaxID=1848601 RepID=UPI0015E354D7|nr:HAD family hydrolase [Arthrobacter sp. MYb227]
MNNVTSVPNPGSRSNAVARIRGVLFDIDDTLVDLNSASIRGFHRMTEQDFGDLAPEDREHIAKDYADDGAGAYERYMSGELTFLGQRAERIRRAYGLAKLQAPEAEALGIWSAEYERTVRSMWEPYPDVHACLDSLDVMGIPYGAVSNNIESYQRDKLVLSGLERIAIVVGSDTAGAPKPDPRPFHEGCRLLGTKIRETLYVGDNPINDVQGAKSAGLQAVLINRAPNHMPSSSELLGSHTSLNSIISENLGFFG